MDKLKPRGDRKQNQPETEDETLQQEARRELEVIGDRGLPSDERKRDNFLIGQQRGHQSDAKQ